MWRFIEERIRSCSTGWIEIEHVPGRATEDMMKQGRADEEHRMANDEADIFANKGSIVGGPSQEMAYLEKVECTRLQQEMTIGILEERGYLD